MNIFQRIRDYGHDDDFEPQHGPAFVPTALSPGSVEKIELLRKRLRITVVASQGRKGL